MIFCFHQVRAGWSLLLNLLLNGSEVEGLARLGMGCVNVAEIGFIVELVVIFAV